MDLLTISTAGSVDDGKSTLIGRLLYETDSLKTDQVEAIKRSSENKGFDFIDWSLATDGLIAEREQGITIDVANIYFTTEKRRFIIADTPGHVEYTRNMVTGSSHSDLSLILIDARKGVIEQTFRHYFITNLLKLKNIVVCINKMDLMGYDEQVYENIKKDFLDLQQKSGFVDQKITFIPISALFGDNVTEKSSQMTWYEGKPLLEHLEKTKRETDTVLPARLPVQYVIRPKKEAYLDYRGFAGKIASGSFKVGDEIVVLPTKRTSTIKAIEQYGKSIDEANADENITILLNDEIGVSRGNMIVKSDNIPTATKEVHAQVCWMHDRPLQNFGRYAIQHGVNTVQAKLLKIEETIDPISYAKADDVRELKMNEIGTVVFRTAAELFVDSYHSNPKNGAFIIIDLETNNTVGAGFIL